MDLVNQYLRAVAALLPRSQREDIVAELRDTILSEIEAKETELGRSLTNDEIEEVLRGVGHPIMVAGRYREGPQHVVGPALYPYWMFAAKVVIAIQVTVAVIVLIVRVLTGEDVGYALGQAIGQGLVGAMTFVGFITLAAFLMERRKVNLTLPDRWRVRDLRALEYAGWDLWDLRDYFGRYERPQRPTGAVEGREARAYRHMSRRRRSIAAEAISAIVITVVFILWWCGGIHFGVVGHASDLRELGIDPGALQGVSWADIHAMLFAPALAYGLAVICRSVVVLANPDAVRLRGVIDLAMGLGFLALCAWVWTASPIAPAIQVDSLSALLLEVKTAFQNSPPLALEPILTIILAFAAFGGACRVIQGLWELVVPYRPVTA